MATARRERAKWGRAESWSRASVVEARTAFSGLKVSLSSRETSGIRASIRVCYGDDGSAGNPKERRQKTIMNSQGREMWDLDEYSAGARKVKRGSGRKISYFVEISVEMRLAGDFEAKIRLYQIGKYNERKKNVNLFFPS